jgi:SAM-dependent methyltransferase
MPNPIFQETLPKEKAAGQLTPAVVDYYSQTIEDYRVWSRNGYMHFGLWRPWLNPFNRRAMLEAMNDLVFASLGLPESLEQSSAKSIGDFGCGLAAVSQYGHQRFPQHHWHAFTICPDQVAAARSTNASNKVEIHCADYTQLPLEDHQLDGAFFLESLCHCSFLRAALDESRRVIKPGGRLIVVDGMLRKRMSDIPVYARQLAQAVCRCWALPQFHSTVDFEAIAADAGFEIEAKREIGWNMFPCIAHSPTLVALHSAKLVMQGKWNRWKRRHMLGCALGILLGMLRNQFGYFAYTLRV